MAGSPMIISDTLKFKAYCIEWYSRAHDMSIQDTLDLFLKYDVYDYLNEPVLRWQSLEHTIVDIDEYINAVASEK